MKGEKRGYFWKIVCGTIIGAANSVFGGGGGMLAVPLLKKTGLQEKCAHATAILLILPISLLSFLLYAVRGFYEASVLLPTAIGVALGGTVGAKLLNVLPVSTIELIFIGLQFLAGVFLFFR